MNELFSIKDKVAVITGAGGVLGGNVAKSFVKEGAKVVALDIRQEQLDKRVEELRAIGGGEVMGLICNVLDLDSIRQVADEVVAKWGRIDILINIAGGNMPGATLRPDQPIFDMKIEDWNKVTNLNMNGTVYPSIIFGEVMARQKKGAIVNISSMAALQSMTNVPGYSAAKAAVTNFTMWLAMDMALKYGDGIRVNAVAPGITRTDMVAALPKETIDAMSARIPLQRVGEPQDIANAFLFLASDMASYVTGEILSVDGAMRS